MAIARAQVRGTLWLLMAACLTPLVICQASADDFPAHVVTIVSPYQAGGTNDLIARILAQKLSARWGRSVVVENRPGANGGIGVAAVARAAPDGHTLLAIASSALTINPALYPKLPYKVDRDLAPISQTGSVPNVLVVNPDVDATGVQALIALAKATPGKLAYASQGNGSNGHATGELFKQRAQIELLHVPYKGSAPAIQDLLGSQVQLMFDNLPSVLPLIKSGRLRALAVTSAERSRLLPDTPTMAESGLPGFDSSAWFALLAPRQTPEAVRAEIERATVDVLNAPDTRERFDAIGIDIAPTGSVALTKRIEMESRMWSDVVAKAGISID
ncbi:tripartite tricarboxylate transporter substrate binding protein [Bradyrhizobium sp. Cp5.3]|uniref:Bug family tripartite tricarboxylate transporter substrate binding protein n=1 Tax=Bradyrhizobium sp. Cp5.3 TaxID=443598 RepID=UPI0003F89B4C|nr:tripartite tricarboxylate transporter substrate binding protein [Bradyrhizobium sp. Cp5.3]